VSVNFESRSKAAVPRRGNETAPDHDSIDLTALPVSALAPEPSALLPACAAGARPGFYSLLHRAGTLAAWSTSPRRFPWKGLSPLLLALGTLRRGGDSRPLSEEATMVTGTRSPYRRSARQARVFATPRTTSKCSLRSLRRFGEPCSVEFAPAGGKIHAASAQTPDRVRHRAASRGMRLTGITCARSAGWLS
jgi:hypothetical protein